MLAVVLPALMNSSSSDERFPVPARQNSLFRFEQGIAHNNHETAVPIDLRTDKWRPNPLEFPALREFADRGRSVSRARSAHIGLNARSSSTSISIATLSFS